MAPENYSPPKLKSYGGDRHLLSQCSFFSERSRVLLSFPIAPGFFHLSIHGTLNLMDTWRRVACSTFHSWMASGDRFPHGVRENLGPSNVAGYGAQKAGNWYTSCVIREIPGSSKCETICAKNHLKNLPFKAEILLKSGRSRYVYK